MSCKKSRRKTIILFILSIFFCIFMITANNESKNIVYAQNETVNIIEIADRSVILNWTTSEDFTYNSYRIEIEENSTNSQITWSVIQINSSYYSQSNVINHVNFTDLDHSVFNAQKLSTRNFTIYIVPKDHASIQVNVNGLLPSNLYSINIYSTNSSISVDSDIAKIDIFEEELFWKSDIFETLQSPEDALRYSRTATSITIAVIIAIFIILFIILMRIDVPFNRIAYVFIFPAMFAIVLLEVYPILYGIVLSFTSYHLKRGEIPQFNWFNNYIQISENPQLPIAFTTTLVWSMVIIFLKILLGFILAYIIQYKVKHKKLWYLMLYLPWVIPSYIKILSWRTFMHGSGGDSLFNLLMGTNINLINQPYVAFFVACFVEVWDSIPLITTLFLGGLTSIPKELNDVAKVDQISERTTIRKIIVPLIKPIILPAIILEIIKTFGSFNVAFLLTNGYPLLSYGASEAGVIGATDLFSTFTFYMFYHRRDVGIAAAYSTIMSLLTLFFVIIWIKMSSGTESSFRPSEIKNENRPRIVIPLLLILQSTGYILSGIFKFRYFGLYWNPALNYVMASIFLISAILIILKPNINSNVVRIILTLDLILSLSQFFIFQMWFAFNWNIFIVIAEFFLLSNEIKNVSDVQPSKIQLKCQEIFVKAKTSVFKILQKIDSKLADINSIHIILLIQVSTLFLSNLILQTSFWLMWVMFSLLLIVLVLSSFSEKITTFSILTQPLMWISLFFGWKPIGWKAIILFLSLIFLANYAKIQLREYYSINTFLSKIHHRFDRPFNGSILLFSITIIAFIPVWNIVWIAFSPTNTIVPTTVFPKNPTLENFQLLFTQERIHISFGNSILISLGSATLCILLTVAAAYAFSRYNFKIKNEIMVGVFILRMFTGILTLIPVYLIMHNLGLIDSYIGVILAYSTHTIPLGLWLIKGFIDSIPKELDESALLMGNSPFRVLRKIVFPLAGPAIAIAFLLNFLSAWNGFLLAFVLLQTPLKYTLPIKLYTFIGSIETSSPEWGMFAAAALLVIIPMVIVFIFLRNYLLRGLDTSVKGGNI